MNVTQPIDPDSTSPGLAMVLEEGMNIGRYRMIRLAGSGGMGEVFEAWDPLLERKVALKSLKACTGEDTAQLERFRCEARALAQLSHPNVCQVYDLVSHGDQIFIAMEWLEGETLDKASVGMNRLTKLKVLRSVALGLVGAHAKGLVHRDLKPGNIMICKDGEVKILDFGLVRIIAGLGDLPVAIQDPTTREKSVSLASLIPKEEVATAIRTDSRQGIHNPAVRTDGLTHQGVFLGSPRYASPEQIRGELAGPPTDVWSLGVVAWELLLEENPFAGEGLSRLERVLEDVRYSARRRGLPRRIVSLLEGMLSPDVAHRPGPARVAYVLKKATRPKLTRWWVSFQAAAAIVSVVLAYFLFGRGVATDLTRKAPAYLAIFPAQEKTGTPQAPALARHLVPSLLEAHLRNAERLRVVDPCEIDKAAKRLRLDFTKGCSLSDMEKMSVAVGAKLFLSTSLENDRDGRPRLSAELRDVSGKVRCNTQATAFSSKEGIQTSCIFLAEKVARDLARAVDPLGSLTIHGQIPLDQASIQEFVQAQALMLESGDFKGAEPLFRSVAYRFPGFSPAVNGYARCLSRTGNQSAEPVFMWARIAAQAQGNLTEEVCVLKFHIAYLVEKGERDRALVLCQEGQRLAARFDQASLMGPFYNQMGIIHQSQNHLAEAETFYVQALKCLANSPISSASILNNLAALEKEKGEFDKAKAHYQEMLTTMNQGGDQWGVAVALTNLGQLETTLGNLTQAEEYLLQAKKLRASIGDDTGLTYTMLSLGTLAQTRGQIAQAIVFETEALELARRLQLKPLEGLCLYNMGELERNRGRFAEAFIWYRASYALHKTLGDADMQAHALEGEAESLVRQNRLKLEEAKTLMKAAEALAKGENPYRFRARAWIARVSGRDLEAQNLFRKALDTARIDAAEITTELKVALAP